MKLDNRWKLRMEALPETGMGYHVVDITFADGRKLSSVLVFNSEIVVGDEFAQAEIAAIDLAI